MKLIFSTIQIVFIALMLGVAGLFLLPLLPIDNNIQLRIVESGSMEPNILTGSLVVITPASSYHVGEVVTFKSTSASVPTTHRIIEAYQEAGATYFKTKGDANEEADSEAVRAEDVIGRIAVDVPYAGFILDFARQPMGFSLLILLPALMIILSEIEKIWVEVRARRKTLSPEDEEDEDNNNGEDGGPVYVTREPLRMMMDVGTPVQFRTMPTLDLRARKPIMPQAYASAYKKHLGEFATMCLVIIGSSAFVGASFFPYTASYFNDVERAVTNTLKATMIDFKVLSEVNTFSFLGTSLDSENSAIFNVVEPEIGSAEARYDLKVEFTGGSELFCNAILADMTVLPTTYTGPLMLLSATDVNFVGPWSLVLSLDDSAVGFLASDFCQVDIVYTAWLYDAVSGEGYFDEERVPLVFNASSDLAFPAMAPLFINTATITEEEVEEPESGSDVGSQTEIVLPLKEEEASSTLPEEDETLPSEEEEPATPLPSSEEEVEVPLPEVEEETPEVDTPELVEEEVEEVEEEVEEVVEESSTPTE